MKMHALNVWMTLLLQRKPHKHAGRFRELWAVNRIIPPEEQNRRPVGIGVFASECEERRAEFLRQVAFGCWPIDLIPVSYLDAWHKFLLIVCRACRTYGTYGWRRIPVWRERGRSKWSRIIGWSPYWPGKPLFSQLPVNCSSCLAKPESTGQCGSDSRRGKWRHEGLGEAGGDARLWRTIPGTCPPATATAGIPTTESRARGMFGEGQENWLTEVNVLWHPSLCNRLNSLLAINYSVLLLLVSCRHPLTHHLKPCLSANNATNPSHPLWAMHVEPAISEPDRQFRGHWTHRRGAKRANGSHTWSSVSTPGIL